MEVMTTVKIKVPDSQLDELRTCYESLNEYTWPDGMLIYLLQDPNNEQSYTLMMIIKDDNALEKIETTESQILDLFQNLEIISKEDYKVVNKFPCPEATHVPYFSIK
jgi:hypothetical protein